MQHPESLGEGRDEGHDPGSEIPAVFFLVHVVLDLAQGQVGCPFLEQGVVVQAPEETRVGLPHRVVARGEPASETGAHVEGHFPRGEGARQLLNQRAHPFFGEVHEYALGQDQEAPCRVAFPDGGHPGGIEHGLVDGDVALVRRQQRVAQFHDLGQVHVVEHGLAAAHAVGPAVQPAAEVDHHGIGMGVDEAAGHVVEEADADAGAHLAAGGLVVFGEVVVHGLDDAAGVGILDDPVRPARFQAAHVQRDEQGVGHGVGDVGLDDAGHGVPRGAPAPAGHRVARGVPWGGQGAAGAASGRSWRARFRQAKKRMNFKIIKVKSFEKPAPGCPACVLSLQRGGQASQGDAGHRPMARRSVTLARASPAPSTSTWESSMNTPAR